MVSEASGVSPRLQASGIGPQHMREIEVADGDAVADVGPGAFRACSVRSMPSRAAKPSSLAATSTALSSSGMKPAVIWCRAHAHSSSGGASSPAAVIRLWAISLILRFWFIAVLRSSV